MGDDTFHSIYTFGYPPQATESIAVSEYLKKHAIKHFPVDTYPLGSKPLLSDVQPIVDHSEEYRKLWKEKLALLERDGYSFLNSSFCSDMLYRMSTIELEVLSKLGPVELLAELRAENDLTKREAVIVENIYRYSKQYPYNNAIVILGAQHRKPIKQLIEQYQLSGHLKLNWSFYNETEP